MHSTIKLFLAAAVLVLAATGCQSRQAKLDSLQKKYDILGAQFQKDCSAEYLKVPPTLSPKCSDEKKELEDVGKRLQDARVNQ